MLRMARQAGVVDGGHGRVGFQELRQRQRRVAALAHAQGHCFRAQRDLVRLLGGQRAAHVAQAFLADLLQAPLGRVTLAVGLEDIGVAGPVELAGVRHRAAQRSAVAADGLAERVHHQSGADGLGLEQGRRGDRVVDDVEQALVAAELADGGHVGDLRAGVGDRLDKDHAGVGLHGVGHFRDRAGVDHAHLDAQRAQRAEDAVGVAEDIAAGHDMVASSQQGQEDRGQRRHAGGEHDGAPATFHLRQLGFQRGRCRRALAGVVEAALDRALEHADQVFHLLEAELRGRVDGLVQAAVFDGIAAVGVDEGGGEAFCFHQGAPGRQCGFWGIVPAFAGTALASKT